PPREERPLEVLAEQLLPQLPGPAGVLQDRPRLRPADLVEEPAAARVHSQGVALQLQQLAGGDAVLLAQLAGRVPVEEGADVLGRAVEQDRDVVVAGPPRVAQQAGGVLLGGGGEGGAEAVEGPAQRAAPGLPPAGPARAAAAVRAPALDAVGAAPGGVLVDLHLPLGRVPLEELAVVGQAHAGRGGE